MKVNVRYFMKLRDITGRNEETFEVSRGMSVRAILEALSNRYGPPFEGEVFSGEVLSDRYSVLIDGVEVDVLNGLETPVVDECIIAIIPPVAGGTGRRMKRRSVERRLA